MSASSDAIATTEPITAPEALLSYTTTLAFYLYLRASEKYARHPDLLKSHPIINRLLTLKQTIATLEDLDFAADSEEGGDDELLEGEYDEDFLREARAIWAEEHGFSMDLDDEQDELVSSDPIVPEVQKKKKRKEKEDTKDESSHPKKKRKTKSSGDVRLPVFDLEEPEFVSSKKPPQTDVAASNVDTYGENTALDHTDATDKNIKKKSLRFHTSKIESASARRRGARNAALGGDDDLPYRKREKELGAKAVKDAKARLKKQGGADLDDADPEPRKDDNSSWDDGGDGEEADDGDSYYNLVKQSVKAKKDQKKTEYEAVNRYEPDMPSLDTFLYSIASSSMKGKMTGQARGLSPEQFSPIKVSLRIAQRVCETLVSRNDKSTTKPRRNYRHKRRCTKAESAPLVIMKERGRVSRKSLRVSSWAKKTQIIASDFESSNNSTNRLLYSAH